MSSVVSPSLQNFQYCLVNGIIFGGRKNTEHKMCVLIFSTYFVRNISHSEKKRARYDKKIYVGLLVKYLSFLSGFKEA